LMDKEEKWLRTVDFSPDRELGKSHLLRWARFRVGLDACISPRLRKTSR
jgi:hypothetical protein